LGIAAVLVLLLVLGLCEVALAATTITVNPNRVVRGDTVAVTAKHVPANQVGEIQLWSVVHTYPFHADANGNVALDMTVPRDIALGDHIVKICWKNSCPAQAPLRVVSGVAEAAPTPVANATPSASPAATSPRPSVTPGATPTHPTGSTSSPPTPPSPTPTPSATLVSVTASTVAAGVVVTQGITKVTFHYFNGGTTVVAVCQKGTCYPVGTVVVPPGAKVTVSFQTPSAVVPSLVSGQAYVATACCGATNSVNAV